MSRAYRRKREQSLGKDDGVFSSYTTKDWVLTILGAFIVGLAIYACDHLPAPINFFFKTNQHGLSYFLFAFVVLAIGSYITYMRSIGALFENDTELTIKSGRYRIAVWIIFWISWYFYCSFLFINQSSQNKSVLMLINILAVIPGILIFLFTNNIRKEEIKQNEEIKVECKKNNKLYEPYNLGTEIKDYSGSYGLICIPAYFIFLILLTAWKMWQKC